MVERALSVLALALLASSCQSPAATVAGPEPSTAVASNAASPVTSATAPAAGSASAAPVSADKAADQAAYAAARAKCEGGDAASCLGAGRLAFRVDFDKTAALYKRGCDGGDLKCCVALATQEARGEAIDQDFDDAIRLADRACKGNEPSGCAWIARLGVCVDGDEQTSRSPFLDAPCPHAFYERLGKTPIPEAKQLAKRACDAGNAEGCTALAQAEGWGLGHAPPPARQREQLKLYERACDLGDPFACRIGASTARDFKLDAAADAMTKKELPAWERRCTTERDSGACAMVKTLQGKP